MHYKRIIIQRNVRFNFRSSVSALPLTAVRVSLPVIAAILDEEVVVFVVVVSVVVIELSLRSCCW